MSFKSMLLSDSTAVDAIASRSPRFHDPIRLERLVRCGKYESVLVPTPACSLVGRADKHGASSMLTRPQAHHAVERDGQHAVEQVQQPHAELEAADVLVLPYGSSSGGLSYSPFVSGSGCGSSEHDTQLWAHAARLIIAHAGQTPDLGVAAVPAQGVAPLEAAFHAAGFKTAYDEQCFRYRMVGGLPLQASERAAGKLAQLHANGVLAAVGPLLPQDAELVNSKWTYGSSHSLHMVQQLISDNLTSCIRLSTAASSLASDASGLVSPQGQLYCQPAAWVLQYNDGSIGMAHTLEAHRQQGLMSVCMADLAARVFAAGQQPEVFGFVVRSNTASQRMMEGLGFEVVGGSHWLGFSRPATIGAQP